MSGTTENYWESINVDPMNHCLQRGEYPHAGCDVGMYEGNHAGYSSHLYGACRAHRIYWHLQSGGRPWEGCPSLDELEGEWLELVVLSD
jgi:hypothetical protein